jgi:hypothetical protein
MNLELALRALSNERRLQILDWLRKPTKHSPARVDGDLIIGRGLWASRCPEAARQPADGQRAFEDFGARGIHRRQADQAVDVLQTGRGANQEDQREDSVQRLAREPLTRGSVRRSIKVVVSRISALCLGARMGLIAACLRRLATFRVDALNRGHSS